ncbi:hypothetical protein ACFWGD_05435 [Corynebacterium sp. NPDC060344]|uniref:hypothetical protein n=1 Tax=Corynebacterium sp. NPDC060344 TaxID=3347101 RepID=UPI00365E32CB
MTQQWAPPPQPPQQPARGGGGNGVVYALAGLVAVLAVVLGVVAVMAFGGDGRDGGGEAVAPAPPAPAAQPDKPRPTGAGAAPVTETVTEAEAEAADSREGNHARRGPWKGQIYRSCSNGGVTGSAETSCAFAKRVSDEVWEQDLLADRFSVRVYSPVTEQRYTMDCRRGTMTGHDIYYRCTGGNNAIVFVGIAG